MKKWKCSLALIASVHCCIVFSGCELPIGEGLIGEGALAEEGAMTAEARGALVATRTAAMAGDATVLSRIAGAEGVTFSEAESASLRRAAAERTTFHFAAVSPLAEEVAIIRASAQVLAYDEAYPLARGSKLTVNVRNGPTIATIRRVDNVVTVNNASGQNVLGESVLEGTRINHYTDSSHQILRAYSELGEGMHLDHWLINANGEAVFFGSEVIPHPVGSPPLTATVSTAVLMTGHYDDSRNHGGSPSSTNARNGERLRSLPTPPQGITPSNKSNHQNNVPSSGGFTQQINDPPRFYYPSPPYPARARAAHIKTNVIIRVNFAGDGPPLSVEILRSSGFRWIDDAAAGFAMQNWRAENTGGKTLSLASTISLPPSTSQ